MTHDEPPCVHVFTSIYFGIELPCKAMVYKMIFVALTQQVSSAEKMSNLWSKVAEETSVYVKESS